MLVPDSKLVYSLYLVRAHTSPADLPGGANITSGASRTAVIEYSGVVVIAPDRQNLAAVEGGVVSDFCGRNIFRGRPHWYTCVKVVFYSRVRAWSPYSLDKRLDAHERARKKAEA